MLSLLGINIVYLHARPHTDLKRLRLAHEARFVIVCYRGVLGALLFRQLLPLGTDLLHARRNVIKPRTCQKM